MDINNEKNELLLITMEEAAEVTQAASKIIRFGEQEHSIRELNKEIGDLLAMVDLLIDYGLVDPELIQQQKDAKFAKLSVYSNLDVDKYCKDNLNIEHN